MKSTKPTIPVSVRNWSGRLCGSVANVLSVRIRRCVIANVPAPVPPSAWCSQECHDSFHQLQRLLEETSLRCAVPLPTFAVAVGSLNL